MPRVAIAELAAAPEGSAEAEQEQTAKAGEYQRNDEPALTVHESPRSLQDRSNRGIVGPVMKNERIAGAAALRFEPRPLDHPITRSPEAGKISTASDQSRSPHRLLVPVRRRRTRRYERIAGPRLHPSHSRKIVIQVVMEIRISAPRSNGLFRPRSWMAVSRPPADRGRCRRGRVAEWEAVPPGSCARPSAPS